MHFEPQKHASGLRRLSFADRFDGWKRVLTGTGGLDLDLRAIDPPQLRHENRIAYLHIGAHKTGTSSLQALIRLNAGALYTQGIVPVARVLPRIMPDDVYKDNEHDFVRILRRAIRTPDDEKRRKSVRYLRRLFRHLTQRTTHLLVSDEALMGRRLGTDHGFYRECPDTLKVMQEVLRDFELRVILVIRSQDKLVESNYLHSVKMGDPRSFAEFVAGIDPYALHWFQLAKEIEKIVGEGNVVACPFENMRHGFVPFARDFFSLFCDPHDLVFREFSSNESLSGWGVRLAKFLSPRVSPQTWKVVRQPLQRVLSQRYFARPRLFNEQERRRLRNHYQQDTRQALHRFSEFGANPSD